MIGKLSVFEFLVLCCFVSTNPFRRGRAKLAFVAFMMILLTGSTTEFVCGSYGVNVRFMISLLANKRWMVLPVRFCT